MNRTTAYLLSLLYLIFISAFIPQPASTMIEHAENARNKPPSHSLLNPATERALTFSSRDVGASTHAILPQESDRGNSAASASDTNYSLALNGTDAYLNVANSPSFNNIETITVDAWIKTNSTSLQGIIERYKWLDTDDGGFALRLNAEGRLQFYTVRNNTVNDSVTGSTTISVGVWHHVAGVFDGKELRVYLDGALDGAKPSSVTPAPGTSDLRIGRIGDTDAHFFNGLIDEARVTAGVLYAERFTPDRNLIESRDRAEDDGVGCRGIWNFHNQTTQDSTANQNHGTLMGRAGFSTETNTHLPETPSGNPEHSPSAPVGEQKTINFDQLGSGVVVNTLYPDIKFAGANGINVHTVSTPQYGSSTPNYIGAVNGLYSTAIQVSFPKPVDNLKFKVVGGNDGGVIASIDIYQDNVLKATRGVVGIGAEGLLTPIVVDVGREFNQVNKIIIYNITDRFGLGYDDFVFNLPFVPPPAPTAPTNLRTTNVLARKIDLAWNDNANNETEYKVERCTGVGCNNFGQLATLNANSNSFSDPTVILNTPYTYRVRAYNEGGYSGYSNTISDMPVLVRPRNLTARADSATQITLNWSSGGEFEHTGFSMERSTDGVNWRHVINLHPAATEEIDNPPDAGTTYYYRMRSYMNEGYSAYSNTATATTPACDYPTVLGPGEDFFSVSFNTLGWRGDLHISDDDGMKLSALSLEHRRAISEISIPYYTLETTRFGPTRGELKPNSSDLLLRSRIIKLITDSDPNPNKYKSWYEVVYAIDRLPNNSASCLLITQRYEFYQRVPEERCEPSGTLPCARFRASVKYDFRGKDGEQLKAINIVQRTHYNIDTIKKNSVGLFLDCDIPLVCRGIVRGSIGFERKANPLKTEIVTRAIINGGKGDFDNFHQTWNEERIGEPGEFPILTLPNRSPIRPGCPECWHSHWRWGWALPLAEGGGNIIRIPRGSNQDMNLAITKYKDGENDPIDYTQFVDGEPIRRVTGQRFIPYRGGAAYGIPSEVSVPEEVVYWLSATGKLQTDTFFDFGGYFNPTSKDKRVDILRKAQGSSADQLSAEDSQDKPTSVVFANLYQEGQTEYTNINPPSIAALPSGYIVYNNAAFNIETNAVTSGDNIVTFSVPSATDQTAFNKLRILHAEQDALDKAQIIWVDRTILAPDTPTPSLADKRISAKADFLGEFIIAQKEDAQPVPVKNADLEIMGNRAPEQLISGNNITYTLNVTNNGPEMAPDVNFIDDFSTNEFFVSSTPSQGSCSSKDARVTCKLGDLNPGARASITIVLKVYEGEPSFPAEGMMIANSAFVVARANDPNLSNNQFTVSTKAMPDPNPAPTVKLLSPVSSSLIVGPTNVTITAEASDPNGSVSKVDIYDGNRLIGTSNPTGNNRFSFTWQNVPFGRHAIAAVATDNQERSSVSDQINITINGSATVAITSPTSGAGFKNPATVQINAQASVNSGSIAKVEFFANFSPVGTVTVPNGNQYSVAWTDVTPGVYFLTAVVIDNAGITTTSNPVNVTIADPATVNIINPVDGASFSSSPNLVLKAEARINGGSITRVEFFANGALVGADATVGAVQFFSDWDNVPEGIYHVTAVATDNFGNKTTSSPVQITVNVSSPGQGELIWFDDALPAGAMTFASSTDGWYWVDANPGALLNRKAHQSPLARDFHEHAFENATFKLPVNAGDTLITYVFLDPNAMPSEIMLAWKAEDGWNHRAYWGLDKINLGINGTESRRFMGALPTPGRWIRLAVPAESVGLQGKTLNGMSFILFDGRGTFDRTGKTSQPPPPDPAPGDEVWFDDTMPLGATVAPADLQVMVNDTWNWIGDNPAPKTGTLSHRTFQADDNQVATYRSHAFVGATTPLVINPGDVLFTHIYLDPDPRHRPDQIILQWHDGSSWNHRAYWGSSFKSFGRIGTEGQRHMGAVPAAGGWIRLEIPASYVGLEGKSISGMAFGVNREQRLARAAWDLTGKSTRITMPVFPLQATVPIYRFFNSTEGHSYWINDVGPGHRILQGQQWYVHPNQAAGTFPFYRFHNERSKQYVYSQFREGANRPDQNWTEDFDALGSSVSFYIYRDDRMPGTVPLFLYRDSQNGNYFYTINPSDSALTGTMLSACNNLGGQCAVGFVSPTSLTFTPIANRIDDTHFFVSQHYRDFFNREPDAGGLNYWSNEINQCRDAARREASETESACIERKRVDVSGAFFVSIEFQETGYLVHRMYKASYGGIPTYQNFMPDLRTIGQGVVVGQTGWENVLETNKLAFFEQWVTRPEFRAAFDNKSNGEYVDMLFANAGIGPQPNRDNLVGGLNSGAETRATVLRKVAEGNTLFREREYNKAFVLMQYFGYLRRNPNDPPDSNMEGYNFWLTKLNSFNGDWRSAEMVRAFIVSGEYRGRFGQPVPPVTVNSMSTGQNLTVKSGAITGNFSSVANQGVLSVMPTAPWALGAPPEGYTFYRNVSYNVATTSDVTTPITVDINLAWQVDDPAVFTELRVLHREGDAWVDRTILPPDAPAPNFASRTLSARVNSLSTFAIARVVSSNTAPSVSLISPTPGQNFDQPASIVINAGASDHGGSISKVEFFQGTTKLGEDTTAPFSFSWLNVTAGNYFLTARATDNNGVTTTSEGVSLTVHGPPVVSITAPSNNTTFNAPANLTVSASANDPDGIKQVEFFQGATSLGVDITAPYEVNLNGAGVGTHSLKAVATDNLNAVASSLPISITVSNSAPTIAITSPASGTIAGDAPASITINASASDSNGIKQVEFFQGATSLGVDTSAPYSTVWNNVGVGTHSLTAKATDHLNAVTTSSPVRVTVNNGLPAVAITSPIEGVSYNEPANIIIQAAATDNESIKSVEFFQGTTKLGEDTTAPFSFSWLNVGVGEYSLTARATDNLNAVATSSTVQIRVSGPLYTFFADDFNDNVRDPAKWYVVDSASASTVVERNQRLELTPATAHDVTAYNGYASIPTIDLTNALITVEVPQYALGYGHETYLQLKDNTTGGYLMFSAGGGGLVLQDSVTGANGRTVLSQYNTTQHRFWRLKHNPATNTINWETSSDGEAWGTQRTISQAFAITAMQIHLGAGKYAGWVAPLSTAVFDNLTVQSPNSNNLPTIKITSPLNGAIFSVPANITINASAFDSDGTIKRVEFFSGATSLYVDTSAPYSFNWNDVVAGSYNVTAKATDNRGATATSSPVGFIVNGTPTVTLTMPSNGASYSAPATVTLGASASDSDGSVARVEFFQNNVSLGVDTTAPYAMTWSNVAVGSYTITAMATDNRGAKATSAPANITINAPPNTAPSISLIAPSNGAIIAAPVNISIQATATDSDGTVASVEFFRNGVSLGTVTSAPYKFNWTNVAAGSYSLTAKATDRQGAMAVSKPVSVTVNEASAHSGADSIGLYTGNTFYLRNTNTPGAANITIPYGRPGWTPVVGDWDGNGTATLGSFVPEAEDYGESGKSLFFLSNRLDSGNADMSVVFGLPGDLPLAGDWNGDGVVTIGVYRPSEHTFYLRNSNAAGPADLIFTFSTYGDTVLSGDWDGDGIDTIGIHDSNTATFYLRNNNSPGPPDFAVTFGNAGDKPVVGDWDGDGKATIGVYRPASSTFYLRNSNADGAADIVVTFGKADSIPVIGNWDGTRNYCCSDTAWFDDALPKGAIAGGSDEGWNWVHSGPIPFSGTSAHQSSINAAMHSNFFSGATETLTIKTGEKLFAYVYLDPANPPSEIMLQWKNGTWEHRAYWGGNSIDLGVNGTNSRRYMGLLPPAGQWVRLEVLANQIGLENSTLQGMAFTLYGGRATWDRAGKATALTDSGIARANLRRVQRRK